MSAGAWCSKYCSRMRHRGHVTLNLPVKRQSVTILTLTGADLDLVKSDDRETPLVGSLGCFSYFRFFLDLRTRCSTCSWGNYAGDHHVGDRCCLDQCKLPLT